MPVGSPVDGGGKVEKGPFSEAPNGHGGKYGSACLANEEVGAEKARGVLPSPARCDVTLLRYANAWRQRLMP